MTLALCFWIFDVERALVRGKVLAQESFGAGNNRVSFHAASSFGCIEAATKLSSVTLTLV
jgi:hypothetical protein